MGTPYKQPRSLGIRLAPTIVYGIFKEQVYDEISRGRLRSMRLSRQRLSAPLWSTVTTRRRTLPCTATSVAMSAGLCLRRRA